MLDAAQEAGVSFSPILSTDKELRIPAELSSLCNKAITQGRAVRNGQDPVSFTEAEMHIIGRYMHCSANWNIDSDRSLWVSPSDGEVYLRDHYAPTQERSFVWANAPCVGWTRTVWYMDDQQQWEAGRRANADEMDVLF